MTRPIRVAVTGPNGSIGYAILFRIASGELFGKDRPIELRLLDRNTPESRAKLEGTMMELSDCAFPLLTSMSAYSDEKSLFDGAECVFLIGAQPRKDGMDRSDLLRLNGEIFRKQGQALNDRASRDVRVLVVGNPCNTNALIAMRNAPDLSPECFSAMMRLDQNRAMARVAEKLNLPVKGVEQVFVWGNHSNTMYPDIRFLRYNGRRVDNQFDEAWKESFIKNVATRGGQIIKARGASSAASAASAAIDHMRDWILGSQGKVCTMAVPSDGSYGIPRGLVFGFPCLCPGEGRYQIIRNMPITPEVNARLATTRDELIAEARAVADLMP
ncbi:MAG: malate dehydrogenase [Candidatus Aphodousia sp.]|nr:malate dehydrogenase [Sutterella sp.]MDY2900273.1 malate dehydrogenase [Candidatus Aphodousia sp.]